jgi:hypothetical protein
MLLILVSSGMCGVAESDIRLDNRIVNNLAAENVSG